MALRLGSFSRLHATRTLCDLKSLVILSTLVLFSNSNGHAQLNPFDIFTKEFNGIAIWGSLGSVQSPEVGTRNTLSSNNLAWRYGFELLLGPYPSSSTNGLLTRLGTGFDSLVVDSIRNGSLDSLEQRHLNNLRTGIRGQRQDAEKKRKNDWSVEVGIGLEFSDSYRPKADSVDIRVPILSFYVAAYLQSPPDWCFPFYCGGRAGIYNISNGTAYTNSPTYQFQMSGTTFAFEIVPLGAYIWRESKNLVFLNLSYQYLAFDGIRYVGSDKSSPPLPLGTPRRIDLSGWRLTFGVQLGRK
jgi:hypothetical protein